MKKSVKLLLQNFCFGLLSFLATAFVLANAFEVVANKDVPVANSVVRSAIQAPITNLIDNLNVKQGASQNLATSDLIEPKSLMIEDLDIKLQLEEARNINHDWYFRPGFGSYLGLNSNDRGTTVDYLIYSAQSWNGIPDPNQIEPGMVAYVNHSSRSKLAFKVVAKEVQDSFSPAIIATAESRQLILLVESSNKDVYYYFTLNQE